MLDAENLEAMENSADHDKEYYDDFYQKFRKKIDKQMKNREKKNDATEKDGFEKIIGYLTFAPDMFHLTVKLLLDKNVPIENKGILLASIAYVILPVDIIPDFIPIAGYTDDLVVLAYALHIFLDTSDERVKKAFDRHWAGDRDVYEVMLKVLDLADSLTKHFGKDVFAIIKKMFGKKTSS